MRHGKSPLARADLRCGRVRQSNRIIASVIHWPTRRVEVNECRDHQILIVPV